MEDLDLTTAIRGVHFLSAGAPVANPALLLERAGNLMRSARESCDFVLVDSPALLIAGDAADLARHADSVLLVIRAGRTSIGAAARSVELLQRLDIPVLGAVLVGSDTAPTLLPKAGRRRLLRAKTTD
jgi:Mrp family chromosome partitioning ATPase